MAADPFPGPGPRGVDARPADGRWQDADDENDLPYPDEMGIGLAPDPPPESIDAGFLPRGGTRAPGRSGFESGGGLETCPPGPALAGFAADAAGPRRDYTGLTDDELIGSMLAWGKLESWAGAGKLSAMAELGRRRAAAGREAATRRGTPAPWSKYCPDEIAAALALSRWAAGKQLGLADDLATRLPLTRHALEQGRIDLDKAQAIASATAVLDETCAGAAEALVVPHIDGKNPGQVRSAIARAVLKADPGAARKRREEAQKDARVELWHEDAGTAALCGFHLPPDEVLAADQAITSLAISLKKAGCPGSTDQLRARAYLDILLGKDTRRTVARSGPADENGRPCEDEHAAGAAGAMNINLTIPLATQLGLVDHPGEAVGFGPLDADLARAMTTQAAGNPATTWCITVTDEQGHPTAHGCATTTRGKPPRRKRPRGRPPGDRNGPQGTDKGPPGKASGPPSAGTKPPDGYGTWRLRPCPGGPDLTVDLEPIPLTSCDHRHQTAAHDPSGKLRHLVEIRDGECTYPPCRRDARRCDFEHAVPWEQGGQTCACNGGPRCRHHHHQKQAAGWRLEQNLPGYHTWATPAGRRYTTGPISYPI